MLIEYSKNESSSLQLKVGRCNTSGFDALRLRQELINGNYDLCRVKVDASDEDATNRLEQLGFPSFFSGSIRRYKTPIQMKSRIALKNKDLSFIPYEPYLNDLLFSMLKDTWGDYPIGYYRSPILNQLITKDLELKSVFNFYSEHNNHLCHPKNSIQFIKHQGVFVGFFALNKVENHLESHIGGILSNFQRNDYFYDMLVFIKNYCWQEGLSHFVFGARNENSKVQKIFQNAGFIPVGSENVFHVVSFLNHVRVVGTHCDEMDQNARLKLVMAENKRCSKLYLFKNALETQVCKNLVLREEGGSGTSFTYNYADGVFAGGEIVVNHNF
jgi:RimJ/RimL family protein N-acetyltransferase